MVALASEIADQLVAVLLIWLVAAGDDALRVRNTVR
jgi:hypothetical protein